MTCFILGWAVKKWWLRSLNNGFHILPLDACRVMPPEPLLTPLVEWSSWVCLICYTENSTNPVLPFLLPYVDALFPFSGGLQNAFCIPMLWPTMTTYFFGMKIWGWRILIHEGTINWPCGIFMLIIFWLLAF